MQNKKLYNIYSKEYLAKKLDKEPYQRVTCSFYQYTTIKSPDNFRDTLYDKLSQIIYKVKYIQY